jgi:hypothetical protein
MRFSKELFLADPTAGSILGLSDVVQEENAEPALVIASTRNRNLGSQDRSQQNLRKRGI